MPQRIERGAGSRTLSRVNADNGNTLPPNGPFALVKRQGFSIGVGATGILILLVNRLSVDLDKVTDVQSRADIISVVACSALLLNVLSETEIEARDRARCAHGIRIAFTSAGFW